MTSNPVLSKLKEKVFSFKDTMPIVLHLRNKHLQDYHKAEIRRVVGRPNFDYEHEDFKLRDLIDMEIN